MPEEIVINSTNDLRAAVIVAAEVVREHLGLEFSEAEMPNPDDHHLFSWMRGRKWFNLSQVRDNVYKILQLEGIVIKDWEDIFRLLIPEITHVCFFSEDGSMVTSPWNDGWDF